MGRVRIKLRSFGVKLKEIRRQQAKLTQRELADALNVSLDTVKNWEQGWDYPSIDELVRIADYLRCDFDYLLGDQVEPNKEYAHIAEMIGIDYDAVEALESFGGVQLGVLNFLLKHAEFKELLFNLALFCTEINAIGDPEFERNRPILLNASKYGMSKSFDKIIDIFEDAANNGTDFMCEGGAAPERDPEAVHERRALIGLFNSEAYNEFEMEEPLELSDLIPPEHRGRHD